MPWIALSKLPEEDVVVVTEHVGVRGERLQVLEGGYRGIGERNIPFISCWLRITLDQPHQVEEQGRHCQLD